MRTWDENGSAHTDPAVGSLAAVLCNPSLPDNEWGHGMNVASCSILFLHPPLTIADTGKASGRGHSGACVLSPCTQTSRLRAAGVVSLAPFLFPDMGLALPSPCRSSCDLTYIGSLLRHPLYVRDKHQQALLCTRHDQTRHDQKLTEGNGRTQDVQTPRAQLYNTCHAKSHAGEVLSRAQAPPGFPASSSLASPTQGSQAPPPPTHLGLRALLPQEP